MLPLVLFGPSVSPIQSSRVPTKRRTLGIVVNPGLMNLDSTFTNESDWPNVNVFWMSKVWLFKVYRALEMSFPYPRICVPLDIRVVMPDVSNWTEVGVLISEMVEPLQWFTPVPDPIAMLIGMLLIVRFLYWLFPIPYCGPCKKPVALIELSPPLPKRIAVLSIDITLATNPL